MSLTIQQPTDGVLQIQGATVWTPLPSGVTVQQPTDGVLQIIGATILGHLTNDGDFIQSLP